jgi:hypothetical protein
MTQVLTTRLSEETAERVRQYAKRRRRSVNETVATAVEEWLRQDEFAHIEFRDTPDGRVAFMKNSRLPVYWVVKTAKSYEMDPEKTRAHWPNRPRGWVEAAVAYYKAFPQEIDDQIAMYRSGSNLAALTGRLPEIEPYDAPPSIIRGER